MELQQSNNPPVKTRALTESDLSFLYNSWLKSYRDSSFAEPISNNEYFGFHKAVIERIIERANVVILCNPEDESQIYGYSVSEQVAELVIVHYIYVKQTYRNLGLAKQLLLGATSGDKFTYTHRSKRLPAIERKSQSMQQATYNPYLI